jgi:YidC/Oxa1 family membrane protein insertase
MDRRFILAIVLMMVVLVVPSLLLKKPAKPGAKQQVVAPVAAPAPVLDAAPGTTPTKLSAEATELGAEDTVRVVSPLYRYSFSTRGGRMVAAELSEYRSMRKDERGRLAQILSPNSDLLALALLVGRDTVPLKNLRFTPSTRDVQVGPTGADLSWSAALDSTSTITLAYHFVPDNYRVAVKGTATGAAAGATLLIGMGPGPRNTESDSVEHSRELGIVTRDTRSQLVHFSQLKPGELRSLNGPFHWVAVKAKYFVTAVIAADTSRSGTEPGRIAGVQAMATDRVHKTSEQAEVWTSLTIAANGQFDFGLYVGPMEYPRLRAIGHGFDDINPYGWSWLQPVIRPVAVGARWLLVWFHEQLGLAYGLGLIVFGVLIRLILWPLNQKAMRASMSMQAIQPVLKEIQDKYKNDPQRLQQEMFKIYKENNVNPFSGCWPVLLPWPILIALFFVFQNSIELRGQAFLWIPDLSRPDPIYIIPMLMAVSMFGVSKIGQLGLPPNPQTKMMLYFMPVMMLVLFLRFAAGLNLYYAVQNLASIPQQWFLAKERMRRASSTTPPPAPPRTGKR